MGDSGSQSGPRDPVFPDGMPRPVADVGTVVDDTSEQERVDGQKGLSLVGKPSGRDVKGEPVDWSYTQRLQAAATSQTFWDRVEYLKAALPPREDERGRVREHSIADWLLGWTAADIFGNERAAFRQLQDPQTMLWIHLALLKAWPDDEERRLSLRAISRDQFQYFKRTHLSDEMLDGLVEIGMQSACEAALQIGLFDPSAGTLTNPDTTRAIIGDASWLRTMCDIISPTESNRSKYDADAVYYHRADNRPARGHQIVFSSARNPRRQQRVVFFAEVKPRDITEDDLFYEQVVRVQDHSPEIAEGLLVAGYDMAMDSETHDRFLDRGILPHSKVPRTKGGRPASVNLGPHELTRTDGSHTTMVVTAVDGAHCLTITDGTGADWYVPLTLKKIIRRLSGNRTLFYKEMEVPDSELAPEELVGATTSVVLNSKPEEIEARPHRRRTRSSRAWAEDTCEQARKFDGLRQDSESNISTYKRSKPLDRSRSTSAAGLQLDLLAYQHNTAITAVVAHHDHTGADVSKWFGQYKPLDPYDLVRNLDPRQLAHTLDPKGQINTLDLHKLISNLDPEKLKPDKPQPGEHKPGKHKPKAA